jgi:hypothetical protein
MIPTLHTRLHVIERQFGRRKDNTAVHTAIRVSPEKPVAPAHPVPTHHGGFYTAWRPVVLAL